MGSGSSCYVSLFLCFLKVSRQIFSLDTFGRQADEYITRGVMFFMFFYVFYVFMFAYLFIAEFPNIWEIRQGNTT
jgi:hypothetical protein